MFYSKEVALNIINYRINLLRAHGEDKNAALIKALLRDKRKLENDR